MSVHFDNGLLGLFQVAEFYKAISPGNLSRRVSDYFAHIDSGVLLIEKLEQLMLINSKVKVSHVYLDVLG